MSVTPPEIPETNQQPNNDQNRKDENQWGMFCHLAALAGTIIPMFGNIIGPLIIWLMKKDEYKFVDIEGKESLNFQISITIYYLISLLLWLACVGWVVSVAIYLFALIEIILASIRANEGKHYTYPLTIRLLK